MKLLALLCAHLNLHQPVSVRSHTGFVARFVDRKSNEQSCDYQANAPTNCATAQYSIKLATTELFTKHVNSESERRQWVHVRKHNSVPS